MKINLYTTYKKVKIRINRSFGVQKKYAEMASTAAKKILECPSIKSVIEFRKIETKWLKLSNGNAVSQADEFENAIRTKNYEIINTYTSHKTGWNPKFGYLYCLASRDYPGLVKIGATESSIEKRMSAYKSRRKLSHLKVVYSVKTNNPSIKEMQIHNLLQSYKVYPEGIRKSNEWFRITQRDAKFLLKKIT